MDRTRRFFACLAIEFGATRYHHRQWHAAAAIVIFVGSEAVKKSIRFFVMHDYNDWVFYNLSSLSSQGISRAYEFAYDRRRMTSDVGLVLPVLHPPRRAGRHHQPQRRRRLAG